MTIRMEWTTMDLRGPEKIDAQIQNTKWANVDSFGLCRQLNNTQKRRFNYLHDFFIYLLFFLFLLTVLFSRIFVCRLVVASFVSMLVIKVGLIFNWILFFSFWSIFFLFYFCFSRNLWLASGRSRSCGAIQNQLIILFLSVCCFVIWASFNIVNRK